MIPQNFHDWKTCIVNDCGIALTPDFAAQRLAIYQDNNHPETKKFVALYGQQHLENVINWYQMI